MHRFTRFPRIVSRSFRDAVLDTCPALSGDSERALAYRRIAEYCLFGTYRYDSAALLASWNTVAGLVGVHPKTRGFRAGHWLEAFDAEVFPLNVEDAEHVEGKARMVRPCIPATILAAREQELTRLPGERPLERVDFVFGTRVPPRAHRAIVKAYERSIELEADDTCPGHPAKELLDLLNSQSPRSLGRVVRENWEALLAAYAALPQRTERERRRLDAAQRCLLWLRESHRVVYIGSLRTDRIFARGAPLHQLRRDLRLVALHGNPRLDLKYCQLAVVGWLWEVASVQECLAMPDWSIWTELLSYLALAPSYKGVLKDSIYALLFGMGRDRLKEQLAHGTELEEGVGSTAAVRFFKHPVIRALMRARGQALKRVIDECGARDAFGGWIPTGPFQPHQVLAQQAQSYEMRMMLAALPALRGDDVTVLSWLHDGLAIRIHDRTKARRKTDQIRAAIDAEARRLGIKTEMEAE